MAEQQDYWLKGRLISACNCDWGCPCLFRSPPTYHYCEVNWNWHIDQGHYGNVSIDNLNLSAFLHFPEVPSRGNGKGFFLIDETASPEQRIAIESMIQTIPPFNISLGLLSNFFGFRYVSYNLHLDGIHSRLTIPEIAELHLTPMKDPITGDDDLATLYKATRVTSKDNAQELCSTEIFSFTTDELSYQHDGKWGEFTPFEYPIS